MRIPLVGQLKTWFSGEPTKNESITNDSDTVANDISNASLDEVIQARGISFDVSVKQGKRKRSLSSGEEMSLSQIIMMNNKDYEGNGEILSKSLEEIIKSKKVKSPLSFDVNKKKNSKELKDGAQQSSSCIIPFSFRPKRLKQMDDISSLKPGEAVDVDATDPQVSKEVSYTPESCLRMLSEFGFFFEIEVWELKNQDHEDHGKRHWRVNIYDGADNTGNIKGVGEAPRKQLAKDSAIMDLMEKIKLHRQDLLVPHCQIPKGAQISPFILLALERFCESSGFRPPVYNEDLVMVKDREKIKFTVFANNQVFHYSSTNFKYAKLGAARKAYETLSGRKFHLDEVILGDDCLEEKEFTLVETEQLHIVRTANVASLPRKAVEFSKIVINGPSISTSAESASKLQIKIATVSEPKITPILQQIRSRIQAQTDHQKEINQLIASAHCEAAGFYTKIIPQRLIIH